jgi:ADP-ribose pyrophosphatase
MSGADRYRKLGRRLACENRLFDVFFDTIETPGGEVIEDFLIVRPKISAPGGIVGVCVLPEVDGKIGLMRGYRHQLDEDVWQAPAGFIDAGESAAQTAIRELGEETMLSCEPSNLVSLGSYLPDAGLVEGRVALFVARDCVSSRAQRQLEVGAGAIQFFDRKALAELARTSRTTGGSTLIACFRYLALG